MNPLILLLLACQAPSQRPAAKSGTEVTRLRESTVHGPVVTTRSDISAFELDMDSLPPVVAGQRWFDLFTHIPKPDIGSANYDDMFTALPSPASWPTIAKLSADEPNAVGSRACSLAIAALMGDQSLVSDLLNKEIARTKPDQYGSNLLRELLALKFTLALRRHDMKAIDEAVMGQTKLPSGAYLSWEPDLQEYVGKEKAREILKTWLTKGKIPLAFGYQGKTGDLARRVLRENLEKIQAAQWNVIDSEDAADLFPNMLRWFPRRGLYDQTGFAGARLKYAYYLFQHGRSEIAVNLLTPSTQAASKGQDVNLISSFGYPAPKDPAKWHAFLSVLADRIPLQLDWVAFMQTATGNAEREQVLVQMKRAIGSLGSRVTPEFRSTYVKLLLANDHVDEAVDLILKCLPESDADSRRSFDGSLAERLVRVGYMLNRLDWVKRGLEALPSLTDIATPSYLRLAPPTLLDILMNLGKEQEAEDIILRKDKSAAGLMQQVLLYRRLNRPVDLLNLVEGATTWPDQDLSQIYFGRLSTETHTYPSFGTKVAWALAEVGRSDEAFKVIQPSLFLNPGYDEAYEVLLKVKGADAVLILDRLAQRDRFQERPLIWKAEELRRLGKYAEAETAARAALEIDPADGDQYHGDRMRGYLVLSAILKAEGKFSEALKLDTILRATRYAERAEDFISIGLTKRALDTFKIASSIAPPIFGIEYRYAVQLDNFDEKREAAIHYERAFRAMRTGLGRVESYVLGSEGAYFHPANVRLAQKTLADEAARHPESASAHYMLGDSLTDSDRNEEAAAQFLLATRLDRDYVNAWAGLLGVSDHLPNSTKVEALRNILRVDPYQRHFTPDLGSYDAPAEAVWTAAHDNYPKEVYELPEQVFPLHTASKARNLYPDYGLHGRWSRQMRRFLTPSSFMFGPRYPGEWVAKMNLMSQILDAVEHVAMADKRVFETSQ